MALNEGIEVEVYRHTAPKVKVKTLVGRMTPQYLNELAGNGGGSVQFSRSDPQLVKDPTLLDYRNVLKFKVDGNIVGAMLIKGKKTTIVGEGELADEIIEVTGETLKVVFDDMDLLPLGGLKAESPDSRYFNFATERGVWYNAAKWTNPVVIGQWPQGVWGKRPDDWPTNVPQARWVWGAPLVNGSAPESSVSLFRYEFTVTQPGKYVFYSAGDDYLDVFIDGEQVLKTDLKAAAFGKTSKTEVNLAAGPHVYAARVTNRIYQPTSNPSGLLMAVYRSVVKIEAESEELFGWSGSTASGFSNWKVMYQPNPEPGWSSGEVLLTLINEAKARGIKWATELTPQFTTAVDSNGVPWADQLDWSFDIGESYSSIISKFEELIGYVWIDPTNYNLYMAKDRGLDRTAPIQDGATYRPLIKFEVGKNLLAAESEGVGKVVNALQMKTLDGWMTITDTDSIAKYGRIEAVVDTGASADVSKALALLIFKQKATPEEGATYEVIITPNATQIPMRDYFVGDWVAAPNNIGEIVKRRIVSISLTEDDGGNTRYSIEFDTVFKTNEDRLNKLISGAGVGGGYSSASGGSPSLSAPITIAPSSPPLLIPKFPTNVQATSVGGWSADGVQSTSTVTLTWDPVTLNIDDTALVPLFYEVWSTTTEAGDDGWALWATVTETTADLYPMVPGKERKFKLRTQGQNEVWSTFSPVITHTPAGPTAPMPAPTAPVVTSSKGVLIVSWDGLLTGSNPPPAQFRYIYASVSTESAGSYVRMGATVGRDGRSIAIAGLVVGTQYFVKLTAVDGAGIASNASSATSHTLTGIDLGNLAQDVRDAIEAAKAAADAAGDVADDAYIAAQAAQDDADAAYTLANGKNEITWSTATPTGTNFAEGDLWYRRDASNQIIGVWEFLSGAWASRTITDAAITNLNAGKITAGFLAAARLQAQSISTSKLLVGNFNNLLEDPSFETASTAVWTLATSNVTFVTTNPRTGTRRLQIKAGTAAYEASKQVNPIPVEPGDKYVFGVWVRMASGTGVSKAIELGILYGATAATATTSAGVIAQSPEVLGTTDVFISGVWMVPAGAKFAAPRFVMRTDTGNTNLYLLDDATFYKQVPGELIVDGAVTASKVAAGAIVAGKIAAGAVTAETIQALAVTAEKLAADSVTAEKILAGSIQTNHIAAGAVTTNLLAADVGGQLDISANNTVNIIAGQIADVNGTAQGTASDLEIMQTYYSFGPSGAVVSTPQSPFALALRNDRIEMLENGNVVSYWNSGQMYVSQFVGEKVILGNHQLEKYSTGTVVRAL